MIRADLLRAGAVAVFGGALALASLYASGDAAPTVPAPAEGQYVHKAPTMADLEASGFHPELQRVIRRGRDLFMDTQQLRGRYVFNDMNCASCHMGEGRLPFAGPVWASVVTLPDFRPKNGHVNNLEERIAGCFSFSMNGQPPAYGSDDMVALTAYFHWLARGVPVYQPGDSIYGRGYPRLPEPAEGTDYARGKAVYAEHCALCHGSDGSGLQREGTVVFPPLWGDRSYNWGAGLVRIFTLASFVKHNMPLGQPGRLSDQEAWDVAFYVNSQERPQDPRYTGDVRETRAMYLDTFHKHTNYGLEVEGRLLGEHANTGEKDFLKPAVLRPRSFKPEADEDR